MRGGVLLFLCACGSVGGNPEDAPLQIDSAKPIDARPDTANGCVTDEFNGTSLASTWTTSVGAAPTVTVGSGVVSITDAATARSAMPTSAGESWINDYDADKGNQLRMAAPIGTGDFTLTATVGWDSAIADLTYAGFALVNSANEIEVEIGSHDSSKDAYGYPYAGVRVPSTADKQWSGTTTASSTNTELVARRVNGLVIVEHMGNVVLSQMNNANLQGLAIVTVRYRDDALGALPYGTATLDRVSVCY